MVEVRPWLVVLYRLYGGGSKINSMQCAPEVINMQERVISMVYVRGVRTRYTIFGNLYWKSGKSNRLRGVNDVS